MSSDIDNEVHYNMQKDPRLQDDEMPLQQPQVANQIGLVRDQGNEEMVGHLDHEMNVDQDQEDHDDNDLEDGYNQQLQESDEREQDYNDDQLGNGDNDDQQDQNYDEGDDAQ